MRKRIECIVRGRVQMVMFRDFTARKARSLGLVGEVRNMPDGTVHVVAEGEEERLLRLLPLLSRGPILARVTGLSVRWAPPTSRYATFSIRYD